MRLCVLCDFAFSVYGSKHLRKQEVTGLRSQVCWFVVENQRNAESQGFLSSLDDSGSRGGRFFDVEYKIPSELLKDKKKITVRFQSTGGNETAGVYGVRLIRPEK